MTTTEDSRRSLFAQETEEAFPILITITSPDLEEPIRLCRNSVDVVSRGFTYIAAPLELTLPDKVEDQTPQARFRCSAVTVPDRPDLDIVLILRGLGGVSPLIDFEVVMASAPDDVIEEAKGMILSVVDFDSTTIEGDLTYSNSMMEPYPADTYNKVDWPGVHIQ